MKLGKRGLLLLAISLGVSSMGTLTFAQNSKQTNEETYQLQFKPFMANTTSTQQQIDVTKPSVSITDKIKNGYRYICISASDASGIYSVTVNGSSVSYDSSEKAYLYRVTSSRNYDIVVTDKSPNKNQYETSRYYSEYKSDGPSVTVTKVYRNDKWYIKIKVSTSVDIEKVTVDGEKIDFSKSGGTEEYKITSTGTYKVVVRDVNGVETKKEIYVNTKATDSGKPEVTLSKKYKNGNWYLVIKASDDGKIKKVTVNGDEIKFSESGETVERKVTKTNTYKVVVKDDEDNETTEKLYIDTSLNGDAAPNVTLSSKKVGVQTYLVISIKDDNDIKSVKVNGSSISFSKNGGTIEHPVNTTGNYEVVVTNDLDNTTTKALYINLNPTNVVVPTVGGTQTVVFKQNSKVWQKDGVQQPAMDVAPKLIRGRICLPLRHVAYALGISEGNVKWDTKTKVATIVDNGNTVKLTLGSKVMKVNGQSVTIDTAPVTVNGRIMLPISQLKQAFASRGVKITWNNTLKQATIVSNQ